MALIQVHAGDNLQAAINSAVGGDILELDADALFTGAFVLPVHAGAGYVTIQSAGTLPASGVRVSPATALHFAQLQSSGGGEPALNTAPGAAYWKLIGLEFLPTPTINDDILRLGNGDRLVQTTLAQVPQHLIVDRCYIHGHATLGQRRGIGLNSGDTQILNCYVSDCKYNGADAQAIAGWNGPGPFLIDNNYLEGSGENVLFGGADAASADLIPQDITFTNNDVSKPLAWRLLSWDVKNIFELKCAKRVTVTGNTFENCWADGQTGIAILFTVRNQDGTAAWSTVQDVEFTGNTIRNAGGVFNILGLDDLQPSVEAANILIEDNVCYDIDESYGGSARFLQINGADAVTVNHNTCLNTQSPGSVSVYFIDNPTTDFTFTNNIFPDNGLGVFDTDGHLGQAAVTAFASGATWGGNAIIGGTATGYPAGDVYPANIAAVQFEDVAADDYRLAPTSPYVHAALDGADIGARFYTFAVTSGTLPTGVTLSSAGRLSGTPSAAGTFTFTVTATDTNGCTGERAYSLTIAAAPASGTKSLLQVGDLTYRGMWRATGRPNLSYSRGQVAFRWVGGQLRLLVLERNPTWGSSNAHPGVLSEFTLPTTYGTSPTNAPELVYVRSWTNWDSGFYFDGNGVNIGGMWFDEELNVLWHTIYATYGGPNDPNFLGASRLNDDGTVTKFGPWKHPLAAQWYRTSSWWIYEAPPSVQAANPNAEMCLGGAVGSTAQNGNWGPGLYWYKRPDLNTTGRLAANSWGPLMGYSAQFNTGVASPGYFCKRSPNYHGVYPTAGGYHVPVGNEGYWISSLDQMSGHVWIETSDSQGIVTWGRMVSPGRWIWYPNNGGTLGYNPHTYNGVQYYDCGSSTANSYKSGVIYPTEYATDKAPGFTPALLLFDPAQALAVMAGTRAAHAVAIQTQANWKTLWPSMPLRPALTPASIAPVGIATYPNPGNYQVFDSPQGQPCTSAYDRTSQRVIWALPSTVTGNFPTFQVFDV